MQAIAQASFGWGSAAPGLTRWLTGFIVGNAVGASSIIVLMRLYAGGDTGLNFALGVGGAFVAAQLALAIVTRRPPALGQWACVALIAAGMMGYAQLAPPSKPPATPIKGSGVFVQDGAAPSLSSTPGSR